MFATFETVEGIVRISPDNVESIKIRGGERVARIKMDSGEVHEVMLSESPSKSDLDRIEDDLREAYVPPVVVVPTSGDVDPHEVERFAEMFKDALKGNI